MNTEDVLNEFRAAGALREGHFVLSSGLHSPVFLQKNLVFMQTDRCERLCKALADKIVRAVSNRPARDPAAWAYRVIERYQGGDKKVAHCSYKFAQEALHNLGRTR